MNILIFITIWVINYPIAMFVHYYWWTKNFDYTYKDQWLARLSAVFLGPISTLASSILLLIGMMPPAKEGVVSKKNHEIIDLYIGDVVKYTQQFSGAMEPDIDGHWVSLEDVKALILRAVKNTPTKQGMNDVE